MTLIKPHLSMQDLAYRFNISCSTISRVFLKWLTIMDIRLLWPDREDLRRTMPDCFQVSLSDHVAVIIDCLKFSLSTLPISWQEWSTYKHHNTAKVLIVITPQGVVSFISDAWGGRVSNKYLTEHCGILSNLLPGDIVFTDRGFDIADTVGIHQAKLHIPAFTKGKSQLSALEVEQTRRPLNL